MSKATMPSPDQTTSSGDPGDDISRRFRYQWTYCAIVCCSLLDDSLDISEVFCEHHEDILVKHTDGTFTGIQVKTRDTDQPPWKTNDTAIVKSCARFAKLEASYPNRFRAFKFCTNHIFFSAATKSDIAHVLMNIQALKELENVPPHIKQFIKCVSQVAQCSEEVVFAALLKTSTSNNLPKFADAEMRLASTITSVWLSAKDCSHSSIMKSARALIYACERASSLAHEGTLPAYMPVTTTESDAAILARIEGKRISADKLQVILNDGLNGTTPLLGNPVALPEPGNGNKSLLFKKLDAAGFSVVSLNSAEDLRDKAEYLALTWVNKHGRIDGLQRYNHIRSLVLSDAGRSFEVTKQCEEPFGEEMLSELHGKFSRRRTDGSVLYDCSKEHLEGFAYALTAECKIYWSNNRPWETDK